MTPDDPKEMKESFYDGYLKLSENIFQDPQIDVYQSVFLSYPELILTVDPQGKIVDANHQSSTQFGYELSELQQTHFAKYIPHLSSHMINDIFIDMLKNAKPIRLNVSLLHKKGHSVPSRVNCIPVQNEKETVGMYLVISSLEKDEQSSEELQKLNLQLSKIQEAGGMASFYIRPHSSVLSVTSYFQELLGETVSSDPSISQEELLKYILSEDLEKVSRALSEAFLKSTPFELECRFIRNDGEERVAFFKADIVSSDLKTSEPAYLAGVFHDVTDQLKTKQSLSESIAMTTTIYDALDVGIWSLDMKNYHFTYMSKSVQKITGVGIEHFKSNPAFWRELVHPEDVHIIDDYQGKLRQGIPIKVEYRILYRDCELRWIEHQAIPYLDDLRELIRVDGFILDITDRKKHEESIAFLADHDYLTGLMNRKQFVKRLNKAILTTKRMENNSLLAVFYLDIDQFKTINDLRSHAVGDQVLSLFANRLIRLVSDRGFVARVSGDEFLIGLTHFTDEKEIQDFADDILDEMELPVIVGDEDLYLTTSIGVSFYPKNADKTPSLIKCADLALARVKASGRNDWQAFNETMEREEKELDQLIHDLRFAIEKEQLFILYQPKVNARTRTIIGAEALLRWNHPTFGLIRPSIFVPLAEKHGWISQIDKWVFDTVCQDIHRWKKTKHPLLPVSINVSPNRLLKSDFVQQTINQLTLFNIQPSNIEFEMTETSMILNPDRVKKVMKKLQAAGIRFALDDFGTGYSSLSYLQIFDIDTIKLDRSLIQNVQDSQKNQIIFHHLFGMATDMGMQVIAEGVETEEEINFLKYHGCDHIQGYYFSRPLTLDSLMVYSDVLSSVSNKMDPS